MPEILYFLAKIMLVFFLIWISYKDIKTQTVSNSVHPILLCISVFINAILPFERLIGGLISAVPALIYAHKTQKMGMGDVKLIFSFGWCIGLANIPSTIFAWVIFYLTTFKTKNRLIPYAPYLCGTFTVSLFLPYFFNGG